MDVTDMKIYDFSLASWYEPTGVDTAMCVRTAMLQEMGHDVRLIFPSTPHPRDFRLYADKGLRHSQMIGVHSYFSDIHDCTPSADLQDTLNWLKKILDYSEKQDGKGSIVLKKEGQIQAVLQLTADQEHFYSIQYYKAGQMVRTDLYADVMYASWFYETKKTDSGYVSALKARYFYNRDGSVALTQILQEKAEINILPDGSSYNRHQLFELFVQKLDLTKKDMVILDRPIFLFSGKALLACHDRTNIAAVFHSEHFFEKGLSVQGEYLNMEYWYWCKYSKYIHTMIVSTEEQKNELEKTLREYGFSVPEIKVIPVMYLDEIRRPQKKRRRKSIVCVARLFSRKKIDWTIYAAIRAHELDSEITLDIYGTGDIKYIQYLEKLIKDNDASDYITLKGHADVREIYQKYEVFLTTSLWETFGITLLEAAGSGLAMVGLDVRYGNRLFIENQKNGYLIRYNPKHMNQECPAEADELAECIVRIVTDEDKRRAFSERSYEIAERYLPKEIRKKWEELCYISYQPGI